MQNSPLWVLWVFAEQFAVFSTHFIICQVKIELSANATKNSTTHNKHILDIKIIVKNNYLCKSYMSIIWIAYKYLGMNANVT